MEKEVLDVEGGGSGKKKRKTKHRTTNVQDEPEEEDGEEEEDARKKARGRPRVDTKDETPAEVSSFYPLSSPVRCNCRLVFHNRIQRLMLSKRRRTQIRLAQRAYRNRKETTISSLEKKVQDLRGNNEEMSNIFINLYDFVVNQGILGRDAELAHQFQSATERFVSLAKSAANDDSNQEENTSDKNQKQDSAEPDSSRRIKGRKAVAKASPPPRQIISPPISEPAPNPWGGYTVTKDNTPSRDMELQYRPMDRSNIQIITRPTENNASFPFEFPGSQYKSNDPSDIQAISRLTEDNASFPTEYPDSQYRANDRSDMQIISRPTEDNASFPFDLTDLQQYRAEVPASEAFSQSLMSSAYPPPPNSYGFTEMSFARRIHRVTTEAGLRLASSPHPSPSTYQRVFGITSMFESNVRPSSP